MFSFKSRSVNVSITSSLLLTIFISDGVFARCLHIIRLCHGPPSWITSLNIVHEVEATRGKFTNKMATSSDSVELEFWHKNITKIPKVTNSFVEDFAEKNLPIKATVTRGYKFFHEEYIHDIEGEPR